MLIKSVAGTWLTLPGVALVSSLGVTPLPRPQSCHLSNDQHLALAGSQAGRDVCFGQMSGIIFGEEHTASLDSVSPGPVQEAVSRAVTPGLLACCLKRL